ncbi:MAG: tRNA (adenine-N1)-methyltransferase [Candidatus Altiarchaeota archaeon]|nr:tRNA (adenine-N1)-methyltransferase [Candidatus Altiarchaeota archaeon]
MYLLLDEKGNSYLIKGETDFHSKYGVISAEELRGKNPGEIIESHTGRRFSVLEPGKLDYIRKAKRGPQSVTLKDLGLITAHTCISSGSRVVDAGTGSGIMAMYLSNIIYPQKLVTYEIREDFARIAEGNFRKAGIENVELRMNDIYEGIVEKELDLITLDLPEPWRVVEHARESLKPGGYLVSYSPSISQSKRLSDCLEGFRSETMECLSRNWNMETVRPHSRMLGHSGFLSFARLVERN